MSKIFLQNLGCSKNLVDGEQILHAFCSSGFEYTDSMEDADILLVNTCAFIDEATQEAIDSILEAAQFKKNSPDKKLIVCGCFSQRYAESVKDKFPEVDKWIGVNNWESDLSNYLQKPIPKTFIRELSEPIGSQYLKIADGCSHACSFCVIPGIKGPYISRPIDSIIEEAQWLYENGARELILVAQDTSRFGYDIGTNLVNLLEELLAKTTFPWFRMMYLHPQHVSDELLNLVATEKRILDYFDIPLQHISDNILTSMSRRPLSKGIIDLLTKIRSLIPTAAIRTSMIIGYPGETTKEFKELQKFIEEMRFDKLGVFPFSPQEGTPAFDLRPKPKRSTAEKRCEELMLIQREISRERSEEKIGKMQEVIIDRVSEDPSYNFEARTRHDAPEVDGVVYITDGDAEPGTITSVKITGASDYDLYAIKE